MLRAFVEKIEQMAAPKTFEVEGSTFSNRALVEIKPKKPEADMINLTGLDSVVKMVRNEACDIFKGDQIVVQIEDFETVKVFTTMDGELDREYLYKCKADTPAWPVGRMLDHESMVITLRSLVIPSTDSAYLLNLLGQVSKESKVTSYDNGVGQVVEARSGVALAQNVTIKPIVKLRPFRTFLEVEQPESEFLLRVKDGGAIGLFEADGGVWKLEATRNVENWIGDKLKDLIHDGKVIVMR